MAKNKVVDAVAAARERNRRVREALAKSRPGSVGRGVGAIKAIKKPKVK